MVTMTCSSLISCSTIHELSVFHAWECDAFPCFPSLHSGQVSHELIALLLLFFLRFSSISRHCSPVQFSFAFFMHVPAGSPSRGGDVKVYVYGINLPSLPTPFYSVLESVSVFTALSTVLHSINSSDNSPLSHSVLPVLSLPCWSFQLYISL